MASGDPGERHGGNLTAAAQRLGRPAAELLDASASLVPFAPPLALRWALVQAVFTPALRAYPDRGWRELRRVLARQHGLEPEEVLPGNGAAELFTWAARDATDCGLSLLPAPGFADYRRALGCWGGRWVDLPLPLHWGAAFPQPFPSLQQAAVLWICNPHNPTGQLWSRASLEPLLQRHALVVCDEAFLPLVPGGESQSLIPLVRSHPNLVVVRSLTKLLSVPGLRLGYALGAAARLRRWAGWRDPWPVNGLALAAAERLLADQVGHQRWCRRVQNWVARERPWLERGLGAWPQLTPMPSSTNFLLVRGSHSLLDLRLALERRHGILLRDCRSFPGLGEDWLRIGLQDRRGHRRLLAALEQELPGRQGDAARR
ncbi:MULTISPECIES: pyridoxal phosphate-dependent aminotransferase [Aphanothece]|uniref:pyridoxal phosphate-dependent aminotransferase n=1 Tax=Aphanothece TaxID=1121 RepID=UPI0039846ADB